MENSVVILGTSDALQTDAPGKVNIGNQGPIKEWEKRALSGGRKGKSLT